MVSRTGRKYQEDPEFRKEMLAKQLDRKRANKQKAIEYMGSKCEDCGQEYHHSVYEFHHVDPSEKDKSIGHLRSHSWERIKEELDKCVMLCANCHRVRHWREDEDC